MEAKRKRRLGGGAGEGVESLFLIHSNFRINPPSIIAACIWIHYLSLFVDRWSRRRKDKHRREQQRANEANAALMVN